MPPPDAPSILVLHATEQLTYKDVGLAMLTTNSSFTFYQFAKDVASGRIKVTYHELPKYALEAVTDINVDLDGNNAELAEPPTYSIPDDNGGYIVEYEERHQRIRTAWEAMRSEQKRIVNAILHAIDIIAEHISTLDLQDVADKCKNSFVKGFKEPFFLATSEPDMKSRRLILAPEKFVYCTRTIEGGMSPEEVREFNKMMFKHYYNVLLNGGDEVNEEIRKMCQDGMRVHKDH